MDGKRIKNEPSVSSDRSENRIQVFPNPWAQALRRMLGEDHVRKLGGYWLYEGTASRSFSLRLSNGNEWSSIHCALFYPMFTEIVVGRKDRGPTLYLAHSSIVAIVDPDWR